MRKFSAPFSEASLAAKRKLLPKSKVRGNRRGRRYLTRKTKLKLATPANFGDDAMYVPKPPRKTPVRKPRDPNAPVKPKRDDIINTHVTELVASLPRELVEGRVQKLARQVKSEVINSIRRARERFNQSADRYAEIHLQATEGAMVKEQFDIAAKNAQWALSNIAEEGERVIDRPDEGTTASKVMIGIQLGGIPAPTQIP